MTYNLPVPVDKPIVPVSQYHSQSPPFRPLLDVPEEIMLARDFICSQIANLAGLYSTKSKARMFCYNMLAYRNFDNEHFCLVYRYVCGLVLFNQKRHHLLDIRLSALRFIHQVLTAYTAYFCNNYPEVMNTLSKPALEEIKRQTREFEDIKNMTDSVFDQCRKQTSEQQIRSMADIAFKCKDIYTLTPRDLEEDCRKVHAVSLEKPLSNNDALRNINYNPLGIIPENITPPSDYHFDITQYPKGQPVQHQPEYQPEPVQFPLPEDRQHNDKPIHFKPVKKPGDNTMQQNYYTQPQNPMYPPPMQNTYSEVPPNFQMPPPGYPPSQYMDPNIVGHGQPLHGNIPPQGQPMHRQGYPQGQPMPPQGHPRYAIQGYPQVPQGQPMQPQYAHQGQPMQPQYAPQGYPQQQVPRGYYVPEIPVVRVVHQWPNGDRVILAPDGFEYQQQYVVQTSNIQSALSTSQGSSFTRPNQGYYNEIPAATKASMDRYTKRAQFQEEQQAHIKAGPKPQPIHRESQPTQQFNHRQPQPTQQYNHREPQPTQQFNPREPRQQPLQPRETEELNHDYHPGFEPHYSVNPLGREGGEVRVPRGEKYQPHRHGVVGSMPSTKRTLGPEYVKVMDLRGAEERDRRETEEAERWVDNLKQQLDTEDNLLLRMNKEAFPEASQKPVRGAIPNRPDLRNVVVRTRKTHPESFIRLIPLMMNGETEVNREQHQIVRFGGAVRYALKPKFDEFKDAVDKIAQAPVTKQPDVTTIEEVLNEETQEMEPKEVIVPGPDLEDYIIYPTEMGEKSIEDALFNSKVLKTEHYNTNPRDKIFRSFAIISELMVSNSDIEPVIAKIRACQSFVEIATELKEASARRYTDDKEKEDVLTALSEIDHKLVSYINDFLRHRLNVVTTIEETLDVLELRDYLINHYADPRMGDAFDRFEEEFIGYWNITIEELDELKENSGTSKVHVSHTTINASFTHINLMDIDIGVNDPEGNGIYINPDYHPVLYRLVSSLQLNKYKRGFNTLFDYLVTADGVCYRLYTNYIDEDIYTLVKV